MVVITAAALGLAVVVFVTAHSTSTRIRDRNGSALFSPQTKSNRSAFGGAQYGSSLRKRRRRHPAAWQRVHRDTAGPSTGTFCRRNRADESSNVNRLMPMIG